MITWKDWHEDKAYSVSSHGQVYSRKTKKILAANDNGKGYKSVSLTINGIAIRRYIHRMVARTFLTQAAKYEVNHKDLDKSNNWVENLEIVTRSQNQRHMILNGKHNKAKLTKEDVEFIRESKVSQKEIAKLYGVSNSTISSIKNFKIWSWL
jgi:DNA-binding transcriptional regulator YiaG